MYEKEIIKKNSYKGSKTTLNNVKPIMITKLNDVKPLKNRQGGTIKKVIMSKANIEKLV